MLENNQNIELLASNRLNDLSEPDELYLQVANELAATNRHNHSTRANFIREQIHGNSGKEIFDKYREDWDIYDFKENILTVEDFRKGFLWCFRDHTTSWSDNQKAKNWFLTSPEGTFARRYELWTCDNGFDECIEVKTGSYKEILLSLLKDENYEVLISPAFSKRELEDFIKQYLSENEIDKIEEFIEYYIEANPNYAEQDPRYDDQVHKTKSQL